MIYFFIPNKETAKSIQFLFHSMGYKWNAGQSLIEQYYRSTKSLFCTICKTVYYERKIDPTYIWSTHFHRDRMKYFYEDSKKISKFI